MAIIRLDNAQLAYGDHPLLEDVSFAIEKGDRIALIGRNGAGKSSLMKILSGAERLDGGTLTQEKGVHASYLPQALPAADETSVFSYLASGLSDLGRLLDDYEALVSQEMDDAALNRLQQLQDAIDTKGGWDFQQRIYARLEEIDLAPTVLMQSLSGGWRKRLSIIRTMLSDPALLLLDEPTNHLDIPAIEWLQAQLKRFSGSLVLISHDRRFLTEMATQIYWLERGKLRQFTGSYDKFIEQKEHILAVEETQNALFDKQLAEEEKWIRQGIKARRTRNEGRVRALEAMRKQRAGRVEKKGNVSMQIDEAEKSGKLVAELKHVHFAYEGRPIIQDASLLVQRGDRIGIVGRNGVGKTTLIKLILGQLAADEGTIRLGSKQLVAYFDQNRQQLNEAQSVGDNLAEGREFIDINGKQKHVMSYLSDFLFTPQRVRSPVSTLSGGERNRLLLAKIFSKPANVLILDEPSNDLDIETLELLEELIADFKGSVLVISHDRAFIDYVVSSTLFVDEEGFVYPYVGGYDDLQRQHGELWYKERRIQKIEPKVDDSSAKKAVSPVVKKLSYKEKRELDMLPSLIEEAEQAIKDLEQSMAEPKFYKQSKDAISEVTNQLSDLQNQLEKYYDRWSEIDSL